MDKIRGYGKMMLVGAGEGALIAIPFVVNALEHASGLAAIGMGVLAVGVGALAGPAGKAIYTLWNDPTLLKAEKKNHVVPPFYSVINVENAAPPYDGKIVAPFVKSSSDAQENLTDRAKAKRL